MGEDFLRRRNDRFIRQRDARFVEEIGPDLFSTCLPDAVVNVCGTALGDVSGGAGRRPGRAGRARSRPRDPSDPEQVVSAAEKRLHALDAFRLDNTTISAGCLKCPLLKQCGGYTRAGGGWSCMDRCASCDSSCDLVCLKKPGDFVRALLEIDG